MLESISITSKFLRLHVCRRIFSWFCFYIHNMFLYKTQRDSQKPCDCSDCAFALAIRRLFLALRYANRSLYGCSDALSKN